MKRYFAFLMALTMLLASCSVAPGNTTITESSAPKTTGEESTERYQANLPEGFTFEGKTFTILCNDYSVPGWDQRDIYSDQMDGTPVNDAVFIRNSNVETKYDCAIKQIKTLSLYGELGIIIKAGDQSVDIATPYFWCGLLAETASGGAFINLHNITSMDLSKPWYDQRSVEDFNVLGKLYFITSDLTIGDMIATSGIVFNKQLYEDYHYGDSYGNIYDLVRNGQWTFDKFKNMVIALSKDLNGDEKMTDEDFYGLLYQRDSVPSFYNSMGIRGASLDNELVPYFSLVNEANATKLDAIFDFLYSKNNCFHVMNWFDPTPVDFTTGMCRMFMQNQAMFMWIRFADVEILRSMEIDFGIVPVPKWDEAQKEYFSTVNNFMGTATVVPVSCADPEQEGYFLEALCSESKNELIPAYYDVALHGKITRDEESSEMLDIIFGNRVYDIGDIFNFGGFSQKIYQMSVTYNSSYAVIWAKGERSYDKALERFLSKYSKLEH